MTTFGDNDEIHTNVSVSSTTTFVYRKEIVDDDGNCEFCAEISFKIPNKVIQDPERTVFHHGKFCKSCEEYPPGSGHIASTCYCGKKSTRQILIQRTLSHGDHPYPYLVVADCPSCHGPTSGAINKCMCGETSIQFVVIAK